MKLTARLILIISILTLFAFPVLADQEEIYEQQEEPTVLDKVKWQAGPGSGQLGNIADVKIPEGYIFADGDDTRLLMEAMQNIVTNQELGFLAPDTLQWFLVFEFDEIGYVKDDEKDSLDADAMLKSIMAANEAGNKEREKRGWTLFHVTGWQQPPQYNPNTQNLEWAIKGESGGETIVNYNTRLLGRNGVMEVTLVADPQLLPEVMPLYQNLIAGFSYQSGHKYAEFRKGDKIAKYGLTALVVGGATAVAAKSGLLKYLWKGLIIVGVAVAGFFRKIFGKKKSDPGNPVT